MDAARSVTATFDLEPTRDRRPVGHADRFAGSSYGRKRDPLLPHRHQLRAGRRGSGIVLVDTLPSGSTLFAAESPGCTSALGVVTCAIGSLASGASVNISIVVLAPTVATMTTITNTATVSGNEDDPSLANNTSSEVTSVQPPATNPDTASGWITAAGGTVATNAAKPPTKKDPMTTAVTVPPGFPGLVTIAEGPITTCPISVVCFGQQAEISAPTTTASQPLRPGLLVSPRVVAGWNTAYRDDDVPRRRRGPAMQQLIRHGLARPVHPLGRAREGLHNRDRAEFRERELGRRAALTSAAARLPSPIDSWHDRLPAVRRAES